MFVSNSTVFADSTVFTGNAPTSYTDLDLSSIIGSGVHIVLLNVGTTSGGAMGYSFKTKGDSNYDYYSNGYSQSQPYTPSDSYRATFIVRTDNDGKIQWYAQQNYPVTVKIMSWWDDQANNNSGGCTTFSCLTGIPTTLSGYGITDAVPSSRTLTIDSTAYDLSANRSWTTSGGCTSNCGDVTNVDATTDMKPVVIGLGVLAFLFTFFSFINYFKKKI